VEADSVSAFKSRLHKYWVNQEVVYDNKSDLTGTRGWRCTSLYCNVMLCYLIFGHGGLPAPVTLHWIGLKVASLSYIRWQWRNFFIPIYASCSGRHSAGQGNV